MLFVVGIAEISCKKTKVVKVLKLRRKPIRVQGYRTTVFKLVAFAVGRAVESHEMGGDASCKWPSVKGTWIIVPLVFRHTYKSSSFVNAYLRWMEWLHRTRRCMCSRKLPVKGVVI